MACWIQIPKSGLRLWGVRSERNIYGSTTLQFSHMYQAVFMRCCFYFSFSTCQNTVEKMSLQMLFIYKKNSPNLKNKKIKHYFLLLFMITKNRCLQVGDLRLGFAYVEQWESQRGRYICDADRKESYNSGNIIRNNTTALTSVCLPLHFDSDPDPPFYFHADPDPTFLFVADPVPDPVPY